MSLYLVAAYPASNAQKGRNKKKRKTKAGAISYVQVEKGDEESFAAGKAAVSDDLRKSLDDKRKQLEARFARNEEGTRSPRPLETDQSAAGERVTSEGMTSAEARDDMTGVAERVKETRQEVLANVGVKHHNLVEIPKSRQLEPAKSGKGLNDRIVSVLSFSQLLH